MSDQTWVIDPEKSKILFSVKHLLFSKVRGRFLRFNGTLQHHPGNPCQSHVETSIEVASIETGDRHRDDHLRGPDFFNPSAFPFIRFCSKSFSPPGQGSFVILGDLEMHGVTKAIELKANGLREWIQEPNGKSSMAVIAETTLNRKDFGLGWNPAIEAGGLTVGEEVAIRLEITWTKA